MNKLTIAAILALVTLAMLAERERRADRTHIEALQSQHIVPVKPALFWPPAEPGPAPHVCPPGAGVQLPVVTVPMILEEMP